MAPFADSQHCVAFPLAEEDAAGANGHCSPHVSAAACVTMEQIVGGDTAPFYTVK